MKKILLVISILMFVKWVQAQDPSFSQFFSSPLNVNPALTAMANALRVGDRVLERLA